MEGTQLCINIILSRSKDDADEIAIRFMEKFENFS